MTIQQLILLAENRLAYYCQARALAWQTGDAAALADAEANISETELTLGKLRSL
jgi:hypothetical protein